MRGNDMTYGGSGSELIDCAYPETRRAMAKKPPMPTAARIWSSTARPLFTLTDERLDACVRAFLLPLHSGAKKRRSTFSPKGTPGVKDPGG